MKKLSMAEAMNIVGGCVDTCDITYSKVTVGTNTPVCVETTTCVDKYGNATRTVNQVNAVFCPTSSVPN